VRVPVDPQLAAEHLLAWYQTNRRALPWRETTDPYAILVSEVMLQQTQVSRVVGRYTAWIERWPTADALAAATVAEVITAWSGLGYNRRAVNLHRAAQVIVRDGMPRTIDSFRRLPGVGEYTATAVAAIAFGVDRVPVDVNVQRIYDRALAGAAMTPPPGRSAELTQALFDVGATICVARRPRCDACPLQAGCPSAGSVFAPARRQAPFPGSRRQRRGALLRNAGEGGVVVDDDNREIADALVADGLAELRDGTLRLPSC
jgi:A/G-specific adenine glycosylase